MKGDLLEEIGLPGLLQSHMLLGLKEDMLQASSWPLTPTHFDKVTAMRGTIQSQQAQPSA